MAGFTRNQVDITGYDANVSKEEKTEILINPEEYLKEYVEEFYEIVETSEKIFISADFLDEYAKYGWY